MYYRNCTDMGELMTVLCIAQEHNVTAFVKPHRIEFFPEEGSTIAQVMEDCGYPITEGEEYEC